MLYPAELRALSVEEPRKGHKNCAFLDFPWLSATPKDSPRKRLKESASGNRWQIVPRGFPSPGGHIEHRSGACGVATGLATNSNGGNGASFPRRLRRLEGWHQPFARAVFEVRDAATFRKRQRAGVLHNASRIGGRVQHFQRGDCPSHPCSSAAKCLSYGSSSSASMVAKISS